jgi:RNA polymerase sigma-70 factor (ECF subfamily)
MTAFATPLSDEELMVKTKAGDLTAFDTLVRRHYGRLALYISNVLGNGENAEDLAQETFLRVYYARGRYVPKAKWTTWLRKIAQNLSRDDRRRRHYRVAYSLDEAIALTSATTVSLYESIPDSNAHGPDTILCDQEARTTLRRGLEDLSPKHAEVLRMRVYEEMNYREIADTLGCSLGTVKSRIHYAVRELRSQLRPDAVSTDPTDAFGSADSHAARDPRRALV